MGRLTEGIGGGTKGAIDINYLRADITDLQRRIKLVGDRVKKDKKEVFTKAAAPVVVASKSILGSSGLRSPGLARKIKGFRGAVSATYGEDGIRGRYFPGNLEKSLRILDLKKTQNIFVGPRILKKAGTGAGSFGKSESRANAYYAQMVFGSALAFGKKITQRALQVATPQAINIINFEIRESIRKEAKKQGL